MVVPPLQHLGGSTKLRKLLCCLNIKANADTTSEGLRKVAAYAT
jgi:hypothetical protein